METFAPAYFDYMSAAVSANVSIYLAYCDGVLIMSIYLAPHSACKSFRLLQNHFQEDESRKRTREIQINSNEFAGYGESLL